MRYSLSASMLTILAACFPSCIIAIGPGVTDGVETGWSSWQHKGKRGSGIEATQTRELPEFHAIRIEGSCDVQASVGGEQSVAISADDNLVSDLMTEVWDGVLVISMREDTYASFRVRPRAVIAVKRLDGLYIESSGDVEASGIDSESFDARISGSGDLRLQGRAAKLVLAISGSGDGDLSELETSEASVSIEGSGDVRVRCSSSLSAAVSGSGDVEYIGSPHTSISVSG